MVVPSAIERNEFHVTLINVGELTDPGEDARERLRLDGGRNVGGGQ